VALFCGLTYAEESGMPSSRISDEHLREYSDLAENWMQQYLRVDTTNPPGNEMRGAEFFKKILDNEGIENRVFEIAPGRGDLWARIPANSDKNPHFSQKQGEVGHPLRSL
jgi:acetylornithine deacetylase/succinyl-diaminopimelate desuccinylase-like protein